MVEKERLIFGKHTLEDANRMNPRSVNPCVDLYGPAEPPRNCGGCKHLIKRGGGTRAYYKCDLRKMTKGPGTDHRVHWPACAKWQG